MDMKLHVLMERIVGTFEFEGFSESGHWSIQTAIIVVLPGGESKVRVKPYCNELRTIIGYCNA